MSLNSQNHREIHETSPKSFSVIAMDTKKKELIGFVDVQVDDFRRERKDVNSWFPLQVSEKYSKRSSPTKENPEIQLTFHFHGAEEGAM